MPSNLNGIYVMSLETQVVFYVCICVYIQAEQYKFQSSFGWGEGGEFCMWIVHQTPKMESTKYKDHQQQHLNEARDIYTFYIFYMTWNDVDEISMGTASYGAQGHIHTHTNTHTCGKCFILLNVKSLIAKPILVFISWRFSSSVEKLFWRLCASWFLGLAKPVNQTCVVLCSAFERLSLVLIPLLLLLLLHLNFFLLHFIFVFIIGSSSSPWL